MKSTPIQNLSISKGEFPEPKPTFLSSHELHPRFKAIVRAQPFSGHENEDPCHHLQEFKEMCSCLSISGMTQQTLRNHSYPIQIIEANSAGNDYQHQTNKA